MNPVSEGVSRTKPAPRVFVPLHVEERWPVLGARVHMLEGHTMGTGWQLRWSGPPAPALAPIRRAVEAELDLVVAQMSQWRPDSDLSRFNAAAPGHWQSLPAAFAEVLTCALEVAQTSGGAFDPTVGHAVAHWGFGPQSRFDVPGYEPPARAPGKAATGRWKALRFDAHQPGGVALDLSAIAKGHSVDRMVLCLCMRSLGFHDVLAEVGGELRGCGLRPDGQPWWVDVAMPDGQPANNRVALHGLSIATSGDAWRCYRDQQGRFWSHTINPHRAEPISHGLASVSVLHEECMRADAWSSALTVLGLEQGMALAQRLGLAALFVQRRAGGGFEQHLSSALAELTT